MPRKESQIEQEGPGLHSLVLEAKKKDIWNAVLALRVVNAILLCTFFQPDEFYQAQEPAWKLAFGNGSHPWEHGAYNGPWITWEWDKRLRSSIYPVILGAMYKITHFVCNLIVPPVITTKFLLAPPKVLGAFSAALMDYYSWKLGERVFGEGTPESTAVLYLTAASPWQWFVSTRTFSNCLETTLTVMAMYYWPWSWFMTKASPDQRSKDKQNFAYAVMLAAFATVLRPTNVIVWVALALLTIPRASTSELVSFAGSTVSVGAAVLGFSMAVDYFYYGELTLPPFNFLNFNVTENIADFYGVMRPDYYFSEGVPLLLTTALPLGVLGMFDALTGRDPTDASRKGSSQFHPAILRTLGAVCLAVPVALSFIGHKEVRFIYPILPLLFVLSAGPATRYFQPGGVSCPFALTMFMALNIAIATYLGTFHGRGVIGAQNFIRSLHEEANPGMVTRGTMTDTNATSVAFLMPCHSVPWRSNLIYHNIEAWALTCDPPLNMTAAEKRDYVDEADEFYKNPNTWMRREFALRQRFWPTYVVFFEQLEEAMKTTVTKGSYVEVWRGFNSLVHDDWRRRGDVIVWGKTRDYGGPHASLEMLEDEDDGSFLYGKDEI